MWRPMRRKGAGVLQLLLMALGLAFVLRNVIQLVAGTEVRKLSANVTSSVTFGGLHIGRTELWVVIVAFAALVALALDARAHAPRHAHPRALRQRGARRDDRPRHRSHHRLHVDPRRRPRRARRRRLRRVDRRDHAEPRLRDRAQHLRGGDHRRDRRRVRRARGRHPHRPRAGVVDARLPREPQGRRRLRRDDRSCSSCARRASSAARGAPADDRASRSTSSRPPTSGSASACSRRRTASSRSGCSSTSARRGSRTSARPGFMAIGAYTMGDPRREGGLVVVVGDARRDRRVDARGDPRRPAVASAARRLLRDHDARVRRDRPLPRRQRRATSPNGSQGLLGYNSGWFTLSRPPRRLAQRPRHPRHELPVPAAARELGRPARAHAARRAARPNAVGPRAARDPRGRGRGARARQEHARVQAAVARARGRARRDRRLRARAQPDAARARRVRPRASRSSAS